MNDMLKDHVNFEGKSIAAVFMTDVEEPVTYAREMIKTIADSVDTVISKHLQDSKILENLHQCQVPDDIARLPMVSIVTKELLDVLIAKIDEQQVSLTTKIAIGMSALLDMQQAVAAYIKEQYRQKLQELLVKKDYSRIIKPGEA